MNYTFARRVLDLLGDFKEAHGCYPTGMMVARDVGDALKDEGIGEIGDALLLVRGIPVHVKPDASAGFVWMSTGAASMRTFI